MKLLLQKLMENQPPLNLAQNIDAIDPKALLLDRCSRIRQY